MTDAAFWNKIAPKYATDPISDLEAYGHTLERMRHYLRPHHRVLEIGCGTGSTAIELAGSVAEYTATDISSEMIRIAREKLNLETSPRIDFQVAPADAPPPGKFDVILALNLFHLVRDLETVLSDIFQALPSGGLLIDKTAMLKDGKWYISAAIPIMRAIGKAPFCRTLSVVEYRKLINSAGFETVEEINQPGLAPRVFTVARKP